MNHKDIYNFWRLKGFSGRSANCLASACVDTVAKLESLESADLMRIPNLGGVSLREINAFLGRLSGKEMAAVARYDAKLAKLRDYTVEELEREIARRRQ